MSQLFNFPERSPFLFAFKFIPIPRHLKLSTLHIQQALSTPSISPYSLLHISPPPLPTKCSTNIHYRNAIAPGPTATDLFLKGKSDQLLKIIAGFSPQNRIGTPAEIAGVAAFLVGEDSSWVTGQVIRVNGGVA